MVEKEGRNGGKVRGIIIIIGHGKGDTVGGSGGQKIGRNLVVIHYSQSQEKYWARLQVRWLSDAVACVLGEPKQ